MQVLNIMPEKGVIEVIRKYFTEHPNSVGESYVEHMGFALSFCGVLFFAALAALVHAFIPALCERTASDKIKLLYSRINNR